MDSPYTPPKSEITLPEAGSSKKFWRFYFWFHVVLAPLLAVGLAMAKSLSPLDLIDTFMFAIIIIGLYGYTRNKAIFGQRLWRSITFIYPGWVILYEIILPFGFGTLNYGEQPSLGPMLVLSMVMSALSSFAFYLYAFRSSSIWHTSPT
jgi:hypothetical protein